MALEWAADLYRRIVIADALWETFLQNLRPTVDHQNDARPPGSARVVASATCCEAVPTLQELSLRPIAHWDVRAIDVRIICYLV